MPPKIETSYFGNAKKIHLSRAEGVVAIYSLFVGVIHGHVSLRCAVFMRLPSILLQKSVQIVLSAIEGLAIMLLGDGVFMPRRRRRDFGRSFLGSFRRPL